MQTATKYTKITSHVNASEGTPIRVADPDAEPTPSPAAELQIQLHKAFAPDIDGERWSYRRTAAFLVVTCGGFWSCVAALLINAL